MLFRAAGNACKQFGPPLKKLPRFLHAKMADLRVLFRAAGNACKQFGPTLKKLPRFLHAKMADSQVALGASVLPWLVDRICLGATKRENRLFIAANTQK